MQDQPVDEKYYEVAGPGSLGERLIIAARDGIYDDFVRLCAPTPDSRILDFGVSDVVTPGANLMERKYPNLEKITAVGLSNAADFRSAYPAVNYVRTEPYARLPFAEKHFDIATSNAVLEHMGSRQNQKFMVDELFRVARQVFITVPHRYFPVEHHTAIPLLHYWTPAFRIGCHILKKSDWTRDENLILMSRGRLRSLLPAGTSADIGMTGIRLGPLSSNLYLHGV